MSSDKIIDALNNGSNLDAEDAFKETMKDKVAMAIDTKKQEVAKGFVRDHITEVEPEILFSPKNSLPVSTIKGCSTVIIRVSLWVVPT